MDDLPASHDSYNDRMINMDAYFKELYNIYEKDKSDNLMCQLELIRKTKHEKYISDREKVQDASNVCPLIETEIADNGRTAFTDDKRIRNNTWPNNTILITGDSMLSQTAK